MRVKSARQDFSGAETARQDCASRPFGRQDRASKPGVSVCFIGLSLCEDFLGPPLRVKEHALFSDLIANVAWSKSDSVRHLSLTLCLILCGSNFLFDTLQPTQIALCCIERIMLEVHFARRPSHRMHFSKATHNNENHIFCIMSQAILTIFGFHIDL